MKLKFKREDVLVHASMSFENEKRLMFVGDHGVYLMSEHRDHELEVVYAKGLNPNVDEFDDWWSLKQASFGGDDGVDYIDVNDDLIESLKNSKNTYMFIDVTPTQFTLEI